MKHLKLNALEHRALLNGVSLAEEFLNRRVLFPAIVGQEGAVYSTKSSWSGKLGCKYSARFSRAKLVVDHKYIYESSTTKDI